MTILTPASDSSYLKAGFYGEGGSGKTHTAIAVAMGLRQQFKLKGPIAFFDTERGSDYWNKRVKLATGVPMLVAKKRSLPDLLTVVDECLASDVAVLIVDSITHVWREVCDSYLAEAKAAAEKKKWRVPDSLEFQDWARIKLQWQKWADKFLNSPLHIITCGRGGDTYEHQINERGKRELVKTGTKMKAEKEFQYEPGLLVEFEHDFTDDNPPQKVIRARVWKDRFDLINGREALLPGYDFFKPHIDELNPSAHVPVDTTARSEYGLDETRTDSWRRELLERKMLAEQIQACLTIVWPGRSDEEKLKKTKALQEYWSNLSWTAVSERTPSESMRSGLRRFKADHCREFPKLDDVPEWSNLVDDAEAAAAERAMAEEQAK